LTNAHNYIVGNAASGGWAGYAFPELPSPVKLHSHLAGQITPSSRPVLQFDGNSAHSSGFWWLNGGLVYVGGKLYHDADTDLLTYNPGRQDPARSTCLSEPCALRASCNCPPSHQGWTRFTNTKVFLGRGVGISHWGSTPEIIGYEAHDVGLSASILGLGYIHDALVRCRTGAHLQLPCDDCDAEQVLAWGMAGSGFEWYDTGQSHIVSRVTFRNCGVRSGDDDGEMSGCGDGDKGCLPLSSVWLLLTHSDEHVPEFMQATSGISYESCGLRYRFKDYIVDRGDVHGNGLNSTVSARLQSWYDADGSASGLGVPTIIGSAVQDAAEWWQLDGQCSRASGAPLWLCSARQGLRQVGSLNMRWAGQPSGLGSTHCANGDPIGVPCTPVGFVKHWGSRYGRGLGAALPITLNAELSGALGGSGWHVRFMNGATPRSLVIERVQVPYDTKLVLSIAYPADATVSSITAGVPSWCDRWAGSDRQCSETFSSLSTVAAVRASEGNTFHFSEGLLTLRIVQPPTDRTGSPAWAIPVNPAGAFERDGIRITRLSWNPTLTILVDCEGSDDFCEGAAVLSEPAACPDGYTQHAYDLCCASEDGPCIDPDGAPASQ